MSIVIEGEEAIKMYYLLAWRSAIRLETKGLKHSRGSVTAHVKKVLGIKGNREKVLAELDRLIEAAHG